MKALIDTNIVLDYLLQREPFFRDADQTFQAINTGQVTGYVTATTLTDIFYISRKHIRSVEQARQAMQSSVAVRWRSPVEAIAWLRLHIVSPCPSHLYDLA